MPRAELTWPDYLTALESEYGKPALAVRHEIYFLMKRQYHSLKAIAAMLREIWRLLRLPKQTRIPENIRVFLVVTLQGPSGWATLLRAQKILGEKGIHHAMIAHLRLRFDDTTSCSLARPSWNEMSQALLYGSRFLRLRRGKIGSLGVACCMVRHALWQSAWTRTTRSVIDTKPIFLLHNDFDMMSRALIAATHKKVIIACVQHGIPTDEFFPANAPTQIVWGKSSETAYRQCGYGGALIIDGLGRGGVAAAHHEAPDHILVLSQTHTPIYGIDLVPLFVELAKELGAVLPSTRILLHPEEARPGLSPYPASVEAQVQRPPHLQLTRAQVPCLVIAYSSTAMLEAALAGHYVVGMEWSVGASKGAHHITRPPKICKDVNEAIAYFNELQQSSGSRAHHQQLQQAWLDTTYAPTGAFAAWVEQAL